MSMHSARTSRPAPSARTRSRVGALAALGTLAAATLTVTLGASGAQAHVTVKPESTTSGSFSQLVFRVPNESDTAGTVKVRVTLPTTDPLMSVRTVPVPGWTAKIVEGPLPEPVDFYGTKLTKAPHTVTWTADKGTQIAPGEYQNFPISAGPLADEGTVTFAAAQTYSDGDTVNWAEVAEPGAEEPEHPAPTFTITPAEDGAEGAAAASVESSEDGSSTIGVIALGVAVLAVIIGSVAVLRGRSSQEA
jgi:periplasmic copper chaperone A